MTPADFSGPLLAQGNAIFPGSKSFSMLAMPMSLALAAWIVNPLSVQIFGTTSGTAGAGNVSGTITGVIGVGIMVPAFQAVGYTGTTSPMLGLIVENGIKLALLGKIYQGASAGVGTGTDTIVKVTANGLALTGLIQANLAAAGLAGSLTPTFAAGLGQGISKLVATCVGVGVVTGGGNLAAVGTSVSRFV